jgi:hypothetical protein
MAQNDSRPKAQDRIKSVLQFGRKRQKDIKKFVEYSDSTVRRHLREMSGDQIIRVKENNKVYYYLDEEQKQNILPKEDANDKKVKISLEIIEEVLFTEDNSGPTSWEIAPICQEHKEDWNIFFPDQPNDLNDAINFLLSSSTTKYNVLAKEENFKKFMSIFDNILSIYSKENDHNYLHSLSRKKNVGPRVSEVYYYLYISVAGLLQLNWSRGKENEKLRPALKKRVDRIRINSVRMPGMVASAFILILFQVDKEERDKMFERLVRNGQLGNKALSEISNEAFGMKDDISKCFKILRGLELELDDSRKTDIENLKYRIRHRY